jgi:hypothetical protein
VTDLGFKRSKNPKYFAKLGGGFAEGVKYSRKKLCFTATDRELLERHLAELCERDDCHFCKYSEKPRDGMYLGRCFLLDDRAVGELWAQYKNHPAIFCNVQDDTFIDDFRDLEDEYADLWLDPDTRRSS